MEGPIFGSLIRFALPVLGSLILQAAYGAADLMVVAGLGDAASIFGGRHGKRLHADGDLHHYQPGHGRHRDHRTVCGRKKPGEAGNTVGTTILLFAGIGIFMTIVLELLAGNVAVMLKVPPSPWKKQFFICASVRPESW